MLIWSDPMVPNKMARMPLFFCLFIVISANAIAQIEFSGDATLVTTYCWRGIQQFSGPALQGTAELSIKPLAVGLWYSSVGSADDAMIENQPYLEFGLPIGPATAAVGLTFYTYDWFASFNEDAKYETELYGEFEFGLAGFSAAYVPRQKSTCNSRNRSDYWLEASFNTALVGADVRLVFAYGTYSSKWLDPPIKNAVSYLLLSATKAVDDHVAVSWHYSLTADEHLDRLFWFAFVYGF